MILEFPVGSNPFNGLIFYLYDNFRSNISNYVYPEVSSNLSSYPFPVKVLDPLLDGQLWASDNFANSFYIVHLWKSFKLTHYTFQAHFGTGNFAVTWKVEGSNDNNTWIFLHDKLSDGMIGTGNYSTYECSFQDFFKHIKFTQTSADSDGGNFFGIGRLEFFGSFVNNLQTEEMFPDIFTCSKDIIIFFRLFIYLSINTIMVS